MHIVKTVKYRHSNGACSLPFTAEAVLKRQLQLLAGNRLANSSHITSSRSWHLFPLNQCQRSIQKLSVLLFHWLFSFFFYFNEKVLFVKWDAWWHFSFQIVIGRKLRSKREEFSFESRRLTSGSEKKNSLGEYGAFLQTISNVRNFVLKNSAKITPQNCPKILRNLTFVVQFSACFRTDHFIKT